MLQIKNLTVTHKKDLRAILKDFTFALNPGDKAVIIGEEGNGKSTLLKLIYDPSLVEDYVEYSGEIIRADARLGYLSQELNDQQLDQSVLEFCSQLPGFYELSQRDLFDAAHAVGVSTDWFYSFQPLGTLSGGEKVKLQLARILLSQPDVLLLDEPSNDIDIETLEWLETFLNQCKIPALFVSHDETLIERTANAVIHLEQLRRKTLPRHTIARVPYRQYVEERLNRMERQGQMARKEEAEYQQQMEKYRQIYQRVDHEQQVISRANPGGARLLKKKMKSVLSMGRRFEREYEDRTQLPDTEEAILVGFGEDITVPNGKTVLDFHIDELSVPNHADEWNLFAGATQPQSRRLATGVRLRVIGPQKVCIVGQNGAGKTTLLKLISSELLSRRDIQAAYMPQNYMEMLDLEMTPVEYLARGGEKEEITKVRTYLGSVKYTADEMDHAISQLSGGQKAKLLFIKMILDDSNVLILDEPTRNFSPLSNPVIRQVLKDYAGAIISISHDRKYIKEVCNMVYRFTQSGLEEVQMNEDGELMPAVTRGSHDNTEN